MGPDGGCIFTAMFTLSGKEHHYLLYLSITIPIIIGIINLLCSKLTGLCYHFPSTKVLTISTILAIVGIIERQWDRTNYIEIQ